MRKLENLEPKNVFGFFEDICDIPHGSGNMEPMSSFLVSFAQKRNLKYYIDDAKNVIIVKEATLGYEDKEALILQGHIDMVCEKTSESNIDFDKDGLDIYAEGDLVKANGTTLGGDDGIAVAMALAILDSSDIKHPKIEAVFTVDEEIGLLGAEALDVSPLTATRMINIDSEDEGIFTVSCAGGNEAIYKWPVKKEKIAGSMIQVKVSGLLGGHSGIEIDRERTNANVLLARVLFDINKECEFNIESFEGGRFDNAITKESFANIIVKDEDVSKVEEIVLRNNENVKHELRASDPGVVIEMENKNVDNFKALDIDTTKKLIFLVLNAPNGIINMSMEIEGLVDTSLNLGVLKLKEDEVEIHFGVRSASETRKWALIDRIDSFIKMFGGELEVVGDYPGWEYLEDSKLREKAIEIFEKMYNKKPVIEAIHAGLECGIFVGKIGAHLDCISIGPDMKDVHTVDETLSISSTKRVWEFLLELLEAL